jgi:hypothetical protein
MAVMGLVLPGAGGGGSQSALRVGAKAAQHVGVHDRVEGLRPERERLRDGGDNNNAIVDVGAVGSGIGGVLRSTSDRP